MYEYALEQLRNQGMRVAEVGTGGDASHAPARRAYAKAGFGPGIPNVPRVEIPKCPGAPGCPPEKTRIVSATVISGSRVFVAFLVELGTAMIVASTIVPARSKRRC